MFVKFNANFIQNIFDWSNNTLKINVKFEMMGNY